MFKYDVSVIIAVYNNAKYLHNCIQSVINQSYDFEKIQLILVNDGSLDNSLEICNEYAKQYNNILVINQKNQGVSVARNAGLKQAKGKYIMILDSDDEISEESIENLFNFFEKHYNEVDLVTYPMYSVKRQNEKLHYRYKLYEKGEDIYDLDENPYIIQSTVNIIIKNDEDLNYYNTNMKFSEDEEFNTRILMKKKKIGLCLGAKYLYNKENVNTATSTITNPLYSFDWTIEYYTKLIEEYKDREGKVPKYIQVLFLNFLRWRIKSDQLYPYYKNKVDFKKSIEDLKKILKYIDIDTIINMPNMDKYHKFFVINLKGSDISVELKKKRFKVYAESVLVENAKRVAMRINKFKCKNNKLEIIGYVRSVVLLYKEFKLFCITVNENNEKTKIEIPIFNSNFCRYRTKMKVTKIFGFNTEIDISNVKQLYFRVEIDGRKYPVNYLFSEFVPFNKFFRSFIADKKIISYNAEKGKFKFRKATMCRIVATKFKKNIKLLQAGKKKAIPYRLLSKLYYNRDIWLYCDRDGVFDNSYYQFMHDIEKKDNIKRYYIYDDELSRIQDKFKGVKANQLVKYGSYKHKLLFIASSKVLTSFQAMSYYNPLGEHMGVYRDLLKYELIYLQHGLLHCHTPWIFSNEKNEIEKVVVSSEYEVNNFINNYNYLEKNLIRSGMPRLDYMNVEAKAENKIVFAPTWRNNLIGGLDKNNRRILKEKQFLESNYYKKIQKLLDSPQLIEMLEKSDYVFEFKIHPVFRDYINLFKTNSNRIIINAESINLEEYKLFITDYSSYVFDYVYLKRPIVYFLTDELEFNAGLHIYRKLDLPIEEGFGPITRTAEELVNVIGKLVENGMQMEEKYFNIMNDFFISNKSDHRETLYNKLIKEED